jgi:hypothetical protein
MPPPPLNFNNSKTLGEEGDATPLATSHRIWVNSSLQLNFNQNKLQML